MALPELVSNSPTPGAKTALATLSAAMTDTVGLSMSVSASAPANLCGYGQYRVVIDSEIMLIAASTGGASPWTILQRGAEGSTAATHLISAPVYHYLTAGAVYALSAQSLVAPSTGVSLPTRVMETAYQPNALRPTLVIATFASNAVSTDNNVKVLMDAANPPTTDIAEWENDPSSTTVYQRGAVTFLVPAGYYYKFHVSIGTVNIPITSEMTL